MGDYHQQQGQEEQADDLLHPSLVLLGKITAKIYPVVFVTVFGYNATNVIKHFGFYNFIRVFGLLAKGLLTGGYNENPDPDTVWHTFKYAGDKDLFVSMASSCPPLSANKFNGYLQEEQEPELSPRRHLASLTYSGTPDLKGLKDIVRTLPSGSDHCAANSTMPMNKPEQKKIQLLRTPSKHGTH